MNLNIIRNLKENAQYDFAASSSDNANRFQLIFALSPLEISKDINDNTRIYSYDNSININSKEDIKQISIYNIMGQLIRTIENPDKIVTIKMNTCAAAYYIIRVVCNNNVYSKKIYLN